MVYNIILVYNVRQAHNRQCST